MPEARACRLALLLLPLVAWMAPGCSSPGSDDDSNRLTDRPGRADQVWQSVVNDADSFPRYAFYARISPTQFAQHLQVADRSTAFQRAAANTHGAVGNMLADMQLAIYSDELLGSPIAVLRGESIDDALTAAAASGPAHVDVDHPIPRNSPRAIAPPSVQAGALVLFSGERRVVALPVYRYRHDDGPITESSILFVPFEGRMGDSAWYRLGDVARSYLLVATRGLDD